MDGALLLWPQCACARPESSDGPPGRGLSTCELDARARQPGLSISNYIRTQLGFQVRQTSSPGTEERDHEEDDAWDGVRRLR